MKTPFVMAAICAVLGSAPASAHHSLAAYTLTSYRTIEGTVKSFEWTNPHAKLTVAVADSGGHSVNWEFEGSSVGRLHSDGFKKDLVMPGDKIKVAFNPRRDNGAGGFFIAVTTANGKTYSVDRFRDLNGEAPKRL
ncbi:MAG TPA: DUF6152 family protein [Micropepsaceae bacterium]|nr:DUF6152 family protein [Micropepsaceae bacterium]